MWLMGKIQWTSLRKNRLITGLTKTSPKMENRWSTEGSTLAFLKLGTDGLKFCPFQQETATFWSVCSPPCWQKLGVRLVDWWKMFIQSVAAALIRVCGQWRVPAVRLQCPLWDSCIHLSCVNARIRFFFSFSPLAEWRKMMCVPRLRNKWLNLRQVFIVVWLTQGQESISVFWKRLQFSVRSLYPLMVSSYESIQNNTITL